MKRFLMKWLKLDRWIDEGAPAFWVIGMSILLCGAALGILCALAVTFDWDLVKAAVSWILLALAAGFVACVLWFVVDALTAEERPTPWRK